MAFVVQERRAEEPILPLRLFSDRVFTVSVTLSALLGSVMIGASTFLPLFLQVVTGASATSSGLLLIPMMAGVVVGSNVAGRLVHRTGRYKAYPIIGIALALVGLVLLSTIETTTTRLFISVGMGIVGVGIGASMPIMTIAVQNTAPAADMGAATSAVNFFRTLGSALGVAAFGTVLSTRLASTIEEHLPGTSLATDDSLLSSPEAIRNLPADEYAAVADGIANGVSTVFLVALPLVRARVRPRLPAEGGAVARRRSTCRRRPSRGSRRPACSARESRSVVGGSRQARCQPGHEQETNKTDPHQPGDRRRQADPRVQEAEHDGGDADGHHPDR